MEYKITKKINENVIKEILEIKKNYGLTAENLHEKAKDKNSALHNLLEWNDTKCGDLYRLQQCRLLINEVKVIVENKEIYAFENVKVKVIEHEEKDIDKRQYFSHDEIISDENKRQQIVLRALKNIKYWKELYQEYNEFASIFAAIEEVESKLI